MLPRQRVDWVWRIAVAALALGVGACSSDDSGAGGAGAAAGTGSSGGAAGTGGSAGAAGAGGSEAPPDGTLPSHPSSLPFSYTRPDQGTPVSEAEVAAATDQLLDLLTQTRYFDFIDERVHGWPESDPQGRYWYGTWWSGADVIKSGGSITYRHNEGGGDNNGLRTAPLMEGVCYALSLWGDPKHEHLLRRLIRGYSSWALAMYFPGGEPLGELHTRAAYLENFTDTDRGVGVDYSLNRPGVDNGATEYIHIPDNPSWGDIWVKNKRSKDDMGHNLRAVAQVDSCASLLAASDAAADLTEMRKHYQSWSRRVEDDVWKIATYDKSLELWYPTGTLANFTLLGNAECTAALAIRLTGRFSPRDDLACGNGIGALDNAISSSNDQNGEILRSFHEAAANAALLGGQPDLAKTLLEGLAQRLDEALDGYEAGTPAKYLEPEHVSALIIHAANVGVPLTSREVRWIHDRLAEAHGSILDAQNFETFNTKDAAVPDGSWRFTPLSSGIEFKTLGALLGSCAAQYRNPAGKPVLDCAKLKAFQ